MAPLLKSMLTCHQKNFAFTWEKLGACSKFQSENCALKCIITSDNCDASTWKVVQNLLDILFTAISMSSRIKIIDSIHVYACDDDYAKICADSMSATELIDLVMNDSHWDVEIHCNVHMDNRGFSNLSFNTFRMWFKRSSGLPSFLRRFHSAYCVVDHHAPTDVFRPHRGNCSLSLVTSTSSSPNESCLLQAYKVISLCMVSHGLPVNSPHTRPTKRSFADFYVGCLNKLLKQNVEFLVMWDAITLMTYAPEMSYQSICGMT